MRNKALDKLLSRNKSTDENFSRSCETKSSQCSKCDGTMYAAYFDREAICEQLEEFECAKCNHIEPMPCGYPRFMEKALTTGQGVAYYNKHCPYK